MAEDWDLKALERRVDALEQENKRRSERIEWWLSTVGWTIYVAALTTLLVLSATGQLHHH